MIVYIACLAVLLIAMYKLDSSYQKARDGLSTKAFALLDEFRDLRRERDSLRVQLGRCLEALHNKEVA